MTLAICLVTFALAVLVLLPLWRHSHWLVRGLDFPRLQFAVLSVALLAAQFFLLPAGLLQVGLMAVTLGCLIWLLWWLLPYTRFWPLEVASTDTIQAIGPPNPADLKKRQVSILTANVLMTNRQSEELIALVRKYEPDVLVALESDRWWEERLDALQDAMPHSVKCPQDNLYGMHIYSRLPIAAHAIEHIVEKDVPSIHARIILPCGDAVQFHFLHPAPPSPTENEESAERDAELVAVARSIAVEDPHPTVVTGDLNDVAWSATTRLFRKISGLLDPRIGRGMFNTFHADYPLLRWPLDHLFHSHHFTVREITRLPSIGSDHLPLLTRLTLSNSNGTAQQGLQADGDDHALADEITEEKDVDHSDVPKPET